MSANGKPMTLERAARLMLHGDDEDGVCEYVARIAGSGFGTIP